MKVLVSPQEVIDANPGTCFYYDLGMFYKYAPGLFYWSHPHNKASNSNFWDWKQLKDGHFWELKHGKSTTLFIDPDFDCQNHSQFSMVRGNLELHGLFPSGEFIKKVLRVTLL